MINTYDEAKDLVSDVIEEALTDRFFGPNVDVVDNGIFSVQVEKDDGSHYVVEVRVA